jgi:hypothetical protein
VLTLLRIPRLLLPPHHIPHSSPTAQPLPGRQSSNHKSKDKQRNQIPLPSPHQPQLLIDFSPIACKREIEFQYCNEPIFRSPVLQWVHLWFRESLGDWEDDVLIIGLGCEDEGVDQRGKGKEVGENGHYDPEGEDAGVSGALCLRPLVVNLKSRGYSGWKDSPSALDVYRAK